MKRKKKTTPPRSEQVTDRDQEQVSELRRVREQLFILADAARTFREVALVLCPCAGRNERVVALLAADTELRDVLLIVARMKRFQ